MDYEFICFDCGRRHGHQKHNNSTTATWGICDICERYTLVANPQEWGGLRSIIEEGDEDGKSI